MIETWAAEHASALAPRPAQLTISRRMNAEQRLQELLGGLTNFERTRDVTAVWSLDNMRRLLVGDGARPPGGCWVQVAGSKGKGTTVFYLESLARSMGLRCGVYTSPHLSRVTERVRIDGRPVAADLLVAALDGVLCQARDEGLSLSFFEAMTAAAVRLFGAAALDLVVLEVGLGGRLDATTAVPVDANIITRIEREHTELLGDVPATIAIEKAHTMRPGKPCWISPDPLVESVLRAHGEAVGADLQPPVAWQATEDGSGGLRGVLVSGPRRTPFWVLGASGFELPALALAHACLRRLFPDRPIPTEPVARPSLPGRFEVFSQPDGFDLVLDGAHTPASSRLVAEELRRRYPGRRIVMLFGSARGKLWQDGLREFLPTVDRYLVTAVAGTPGEDPEVVAAWLRTQGRPAEVVDGSDRGLAILLGCAAVRVVAGSFYLVGAVRSTLRTE